MIENLFTELEVNAKKQLKKGWKVVDSGEWTIAWVETRDCYFLSQIL